MTLEVVNQAQSIEDPSGVFPQAQLDTIDLQILAAAIGGSTGVESGCAVTAQGTPDMTVAVASGLVVVNYAEVLVSSGNVTITAAHSTLPRFDLIAVNSSGTKSAVAGTPAAAPVFPAIPANSVIIAAVYVPAADTAINSNQIKDRRVTVPAPTAALGWTTVSKAADESITLDNTLSNDNTLFFSMAANAEYRIRAYIVGRSTGDDNAEFQYAWTGPASPVQVKLIRGHIRGIAISGGWALNAVTMGAAVPVTWTTGADDVHFTLDGVFHNGANTGNFAFQWAQNVSATGPTVIYAGSYLEYKRVD